MVTSVIQPDFMVAALVSLTETQDFSGIVNAPCKRTFHNSCELGGTMKPHTLAHSPGIAPGPHNGGGPGGIGKSVSANASSKVQVG